MPWGLNDLTGGDGPGECVVPNRVPGVRFPFSLLPLKLRQRQAAGRFLEDGAGRRARS